VKVEFHSGVADKLDHACRLLRKTQAAGAQVVVGGDRALLDRLDVMLWTFDALSFVPHLRVRGERPGAAAAVLERTPLWLADVPAACAPRDVLVNLGPEMVAGWEGFARVIEVLGRDEEDIAEGRQRWRAYGEQAGIERVNHSLAERE
jgi:DNA polymerase III subunit chi